MNEADKSFVRQEIAAAAQGGAGGRLTPSAGGPDPIGVVAMWPTASAPDGWLLCDGTAVKRQQYMDLFRVIGTTYGVGDGSTTFNLPNLKGRVPVGLDSGQTEFDALGETGGAKTHTLVTSEMPAHSHANEGATSGTRLRDGPANTPTGGSVRKAQLGGTEEFINTDSRGGGGAHNNLPPYVTLNFIIRSH